MSLCVSMVHSCIRALSAEYSPLPWYPCTSRVKAMQTLATTVTLYHMLINYTPPPDRVESLMLEAYRCLSQLELHDMAAQCLERLCKYYVEMDRTKVCVPTTK